MCGVQFSRDFEYPQWLASPAELSLNTTEDFHILFFIFFIASQPHPLLCTDLIEYEMANVCKRHYTDLQLLFILRGQVDLHNK